jgi:hypothetical protein
MYAHPIRTIYMSVISCYRYTRESVSSAFLIVIIMQNIYVIVTTNCALHIL